MLSLFPCFSNNPSSVCLGTEIQRLLGLTEDFLSFPEVMMTATEAELLPLKTETSHNSVTEGNTDPDLSVHRNP